MTAPIMCLVCRSSSCLHLQQSRRTMVSRSESKFLIALCDPQYADLKSIAYSLDITVGTLKVYLSRFYIKLGWPGGSVRKLTLWAMAHRELLGIPMPTPEQFPQVVAA